MKRARRRSSSAEKKLKASSSYVERGYRQFAETGQLVSSFVKIKDSDLHIRADRTVTEEAESLVLQARTLIERYILANPRFENSLVPLPHDALAPPLVRDMLQAGRLGDVGPMAAVAGAIAEFVGKGLLAYGCREVVVENGGDIFLARQEGGVVAIFAGESPLSLQLGLRLDAADMPLAVCTSSGTVGHSLSFGAADSATVLAHSTALADAVATRLGNVVRDARHGDDSIREALDVGMGIDGVMGVVIIRGAKLGAKGSVELVKLG